ncbi:hypothetical protein MYCTH_2306388 [Thermothelomyces thermophilus ATCC 42464]|uniref:Elongation factor 1 alpha-like protein n=1 Tax=Thermothelomyces thermophilus (strain ATCC 42464 / BCRC 31852 / DSM 1799) TaxID=573729 RepID=G2QHD3_THET4|nr:uncharacterized protein MYCTH_2306388 [Thermothelomyces thermophilus ATCC 42464]AEO58793.1 hypothetical protein MYCTH_2306388 [Thermothelomyces thermophilus ATCC 42464]
MSRHQYIRKLDYEDALDEYEGYSENEEEDELSPEDRALMSQGTAEVQAALGVEASKVTVAQIEEALWHYYYDVDKSVAYLISKYVNPRPKATKPATRPPNGKSVTHTFEPTAATFSLELGKPVHWAAKYVDLTDAGLQATQTCPESSTPSFQMTRSLPHFGTTSHVLQPASETRVPLSSLFWDMPWGNVPKERQTILVPPLAPRGGLLGGSGGPPKMSKLQALAAARKKKAEEKKAVNDKVEGARAKMEDLAVEDTQCGGKSVPSNGLSNKRLKTSDPSPEGQSVPVFGPKPTRLKASQPLDVGAAAPSGQLQAVTAQAAESEQPVSMAEPSTFAQLLCGEPSAAHRRRTPEKAVFVGFGCGYGVDNKGEPPKKPSTSVDWFDIRKRKADDSDDFEEVVVLYPNLPQSVKDVFAQPSPDDIVLAAQAKAKTKAGAKTAEAQPKKKGTPSTDAVTAGVDGLKISDAPLPKSKNLNVLSELEKSKPKRSASFVVVGHVDAGKSTMMGRLLLDLKVVDQRTVDKLQKEAKTEGKGSFHLAWVLDQRPEERSRGITMDIATRRFETERTAFTILDAPGHAEYIYNMIAGASQADFAVLVIDASTDAFESGLKGQTREHSLLIRSMGVSRVVVAINKLDTVAWSQERFNEIKDQMSGFLSTANFQPKNIAFVPVSGLYGDNLVHRSSNPAASWYTGPTLIEELENSEPSTRALEKPLRMTVFEVYRTMQSPVTVSGRIEAGSLQMGDALLVQPSGQRAYVKSILSNDAPADWAVAGQNVVLHLSQIDPIHVRDGDIICDPAKPVLRADTFTLKALAFDILMPMPVEVHRGRLNQAGRIAAIPALLDKTSGTVVKKKPKIVKPGMVARIVVKLESQIPLEAGQRVVLRSGGQTVAAGLLE